MEDSDRDNSRPNTSMASARACDGQALGITTFLSAMGRLNDEKRYPLGDSALWMGIPQLLENTIDMLWIEWQGSVLTN